MADFEGWADLGAQRRAEDEALVQRYAGGKGRGLDIRPVRGFVQHVRGDIGPTGIICDVEMTKKDRGHEIVVWYYIPGEGSPTRPQAASVVDVPAIGREPAPSGSPSGGLASLARSSAAPPSGGAGRVSGTVPGTPGTSTASPSS